MQIALDTSQDSAPLLRKLAELLLFAADERTADMGLGEDGSVPAGTTKVSDIVHVECGPMSGAGVGLDLSKVTIFGDIFAEATVELQADKVGFGKGVILPKEAIAAEMPASFTAPAAPSRAPLPATEPAASSVAATTGAPAVSTASVPAIAPSNEEDSDGYLWDARIHSSSKKKHPDGRWHARRGVTPEIVAKVKAELRAAEVPAMGASAVEIAEENLREAVTAAFFTAGATDTPEVDAKVNAAMLAATSPVVPPPPFTPVPPPPPVTPATASTLNFTAAEQSALVPPPPASAAVPTPPPVATTAAVPTAPATPAVPAGATATPVPPVYSGAPAPAVPPSSVATATTTTTISRSEVIEDYKQLMEKVVNPAFKAKLITPLDLREMCKQLGTTESPVTGLQDLVPTHPRINDFANLVRQKVGVL